MTDLQVKPKVKESIFEIGNHFNALASLIEEQEGEITQTIDQWLSEYEGKEADKIDAYCYLVQRYEEIALESKRLAARAARYNNNIKALKDSLNHYFKVQNKMKVETSRFTVTRVKNGGKLPVELNEGISPEDLPREYQSIIINADKDKMRDDILAGNEELGRFAQVGERGTHIRIK